LRKTDAPSQTPDGVRLVRTLARGVAIVSALYALAVLVLLTANLMYVRGADPLNSAAIAELQAVLKKHPDEPALKEGIRRLDLEARRTFFASLDRTRVGTRLLVVGVGLLLVAAHGLTALGRRPPDPGRLTGDEQPGHAAATARFSVGIAAAMLTGGAVLLILTATSVAPAPGATGGGAPEPAAAATVAPDLSPPNQISTAPAPYFPSVAERRMQWPCFRGPGGNGIAYNAQPPVSWDGATGTNIRW